MSTNIRSAVVGDETILADLNRFAQGLHVDRRPDLFRATTAQETAAWYRCRLEEPTTRAWIAEEAGTPIGYLLPAIHGRQAGPLSPRAGCPRSGKNGVAPH